MTSILTTTLFAIFVNSGEDMRRVVPTENYLMKPLPVGGLHHDTLISNVALRQVGSQLD
jgi:hypothetical protein